MPKHPASISPLRWHIPRAAYNSVAKVFYVSSVRTGTIGKVDSAGNYSVFYEEPALKSSYGLKVDLQRNRLWVCTGDANYSIYSDSTTYKKLIRVIGIDLSSGAKTNDIDLSALVSGKHFANDLCLDSAGNLYVTDSYSPVIYKIDAQFQPSVFCQNDIFKSIDVGLNGIVWHPAGYLLVAHNTNGALYRIRLNNPAIVQKVKLDNFFPGVDGLLFDPEGFLALVQNKGANKVFRLRSHDHWNRAKLIGQTLLVDRFDNPTTLTRKGNRLYVLNAKLNELTNPTEPPSKEFSLQEVRFVAVQ